MKKKVILIVTLIIILVCIDQLIKMYVINNFQEQSMNVGFINFTYSKNTGVAFGIAKDNINTIIITELVVIVVLTSFLIRQLRNIDIKTSIVMSMILSGGTGNFIDRIFYRGVIDYIDIGNLIPKFPIFNISDCLIVVGLILFVIFTFREFSKIQNGKINSSSSSL